MLGLAVSSLGPHKCYSFALGDRRSRGGWSYGAPDPGLLISGVAVKFLGDDLHKFLGRLIATNVTNKGAYKLTHEFFLSALGKVDGALISGPSKAWIYQFYILAILSWPFLISFSVSDVKRDFEAPATRFLKGWYKLAKPANPAVLFLPKSLNGMELTSPVEKFKSLQVSALHQLSNSADPMISSLAASCRKRDSLSRSNKWKPAAALSNAEIVLDFNFAFGADRLRRAGLWLSRP